MRHVYECPMRWADLDLLGHVNNVVYADYLQEARVDMLRVHARGPATGALAEALLVVSNQLTYVEPLLFDTRPVFIECWVTEVRAATATLAYEVYRERDGERTVYLRASTVLTPYVFAEERPRRFTPEERAGLEAYLEPVEVEPTPYGEPVHHELGHYPVRVRFSDVDIYGHVNNVKYFEYFQEGRVAVMTRLLEQAPGVERQSVVVAQQDIEYKRPMLFRSEPYDLWTWVSHVGRRSVILEGEIRDPGAPDRLLARGRFVLVFFDTTTGRSTEPSPQLRELYASLV
ncbi:acyl-CoA thioesterase [Nocardioides sp. DS6]|uniref:Acyl-CoA thioesterase n=1 Tax=Nocardioides eburneus TaxID=3231482 RepID=A0ABV3T377_9ACTN